MSCYGHLRYGPERFNTEIAVLLVIFCVGLLSNVAVYKVVGGETDNPVIKRWRNMLLMAFNLVAVNLLDLVPISPTIYYNVKFCLQLTITLAMYVFFISPLFSQGKSQDEEAEMAPNSEIKVPTLHVENEDMNLSVRFICMSPLHALTVYFKRPSKCTFTNLVSSLAGNP
jgi:succinate dehydrogenase hydrophobic anchor subunit